MKLYVIIRTPVEVDPDVPNCLDVCVGSSPISSKPYWERLLNGKLTDKVYITTLLVRDKDYADTLATYAQRDDIPPEGKSFFYMAAEFDAGELNLPK